MSQRDQQQRKERELRENEARKVIEELGRKRESARRSMPDILGQLNVLCETNTTRAITMAS
jgi:hypothetical protein